MQSAMTPLDWLIVAAAFTAEQLADVPSDASAGWAVLGGAGWALWAAVLRAAFERMARGSAAPWRRLRAAMVAGVAIVPAGASAAGAAWLGLPSFCGGEGASPEGVLLAIFRGLLTGMLAVGITASETRFAMVTTLFVVVLAAIVSDHASAGGVEAAYAALAAAGLAARASAGDGRTTLPHAGGLVACVAVATTVALLGGAGHACGRAIAGWLPLSGGDSRAFPWARDGVGDGENLVASRKNPQATGPVNSDVFVTSHKPSLYDIFNDLYGEPDKAKDKRRQRNVALPAQETPQTNQHLADSEHAGREFSTVRDRRARPRRPTTDIAARALLAVAGRAPVHLRLSVYDRFDGRAWHADPRLAAAERGGGLEHQGGQWMRWAGLPSADRFAGGSMSRDDEHAVTIGTLQTSILPLPTRSSALRIDKVDRADFFRSPLPEVATLDGVEVPAGTTVHVRSAAGGIDGDTHATALAAPPAVATARGETTPRWVHETLAAWEIPAASGTGDWTHVARVVAEFRCRCCRDDAAVTPAECSDTLEHFMTVSRRGRAYDFAGAAALMLRGCGYQTRLAGGLFVSGERRDARSRRLISTEDDAHVWAEILDAAGRWIPIEATPGFTIRQSTIPWWTPLVSAGAWVRGHATMIAAAWIALTALGIVAHAGWRPCVDAATTLWWRHAVRWPDACPLSVTWSLLAWRGWLAGCPRGRHETIREWYRRTSRAKPTGRWAHGFLAAYENAAYGPVRVSDDLGRQRRLAEAVAARITVQSLCPPPGMGMRSTREKRRWRWS